MQEREKSHGLDREVQADELDDAPTHATRHARTTRAGGQPLEEPAVASSGFFDALNVGIFDDLVGSGGAVTAGAAAADGEHGEHGAAEHGEHGAAEHGEHGAAEHGEHGAAEHGGASHGAASHGAAAEHGDASHGASARGGAMDQVRGRRTRSRRGGTPARRRTGRARPSAATAVPVNLRQIPRPWHDAAFYGFRVGFECSSSTGNVADLQRRAGLQWREVVTYTRNDFAHRVAPPNPTILPLGAGIPFSAPTTTVLGPNRLGFGVGVHDTHKWPVAGVRSSDFGGSTGRALPAIVNSTQVYQYSTDGASWTTFAGPFQINRNFGGSPLTFTTTKVGVHSLPEPYRP